MTPAPRNAAWYSSRYWWLFSAMTANRSPRCDPELRAQRVGQAQHPVDVLGVRALVVAVVERHLVGAALARGRSCRWYTSSFMLPPTLAPDLQKLAALLDGRLRCAVGLQNRTPSWSRVTVMPS